MPEAVPEADEAVVPLLVAVRLTDAEILLALAGKTLEGQLATPVRDALDRVRAAVSDVLRNGPPAETLPGADDTPPEPSGRLARIEVKGFRDLGVVRVTEVTFAGEPMVHAERTPWSSAAFEGDAADFPASSLHFVTWLPERLAADGAAPRAIAGRDFIGDSHFDDDLDQGDDPYERSY